VIHKLLQLIATSRLLVWLVINVVSPIDRWLMLKTTGKVSITGGSTILLETTGAKSGIKRHVALPGLEHERGIVLLASRGGAQVHPAWYFNLLKNPDVQVIRGGRSAPYRAVITEGEERELFWQWMLEQWEGFAAYQRRAAPRVLPVVVLEPIT
jgi:deazaflavin-dependent oxidoreductase (nitroreductase family)